MNRPPRNRLKLVLGPVNSGKMGLVLEWWKERLALQPLLVVPTAPDARELSMEMAGRTGGLVGQSPALTFDGLVRLVLQRSPRYATDLERALIAARLLRDVPLEALAASVHLPGVPTALVALLEQLGESGRSSERLDRILARWASVDPEAAPLAGDIRRLVQAYGQTLAGLGLTDRPAAVREATLVAGAWDRPVALYGFSSFTAGQRALVEELSNQVEVLVTFTHDRSRAVNLSTPGEISWWGSRAAEVEDVVTPDRAYASPAVAYLERYFMGNAAAQEPPAAFSDGKGVRFLLASGRRAEAELAAEQVAGLIREGFRPGEIAVVVRHVRKWSALLGEVFDSCGIPYQMDDRCALRETGLGYAFLSALRGVALDDAEAICAHLRSPYGGISLDDVSDLELTYRRGTARGARVLAGIARSMDLGSVERLWGMVEQGVDRPDAGPGAARGPGGPRFNPAVAESLARQMLAAGLRGSIVGSRSMEEDARAFRAMQAAFATMAPLASMDAGGPAGWLDAQSVLRSLGQVAVPGGRWEDADGVQVLSVQRARARRFEVVVILGLVEGEFPGRPDTPSLLSATQRMQLGRLEDGLLPPDIDQEGAFFASAISRPWQLLLLSARNAEDDGTESMPSHYWQAAKELLRAGPSGHESRTLADQVYAPDKAPSLRHYLRACAAQGRTPHPAVMAGSSRGAVPAWGRPPSRLTAPAVLAELGATECFSPSALEAYSSCPFKWFVERVIGAEDIDVELDGRVIGQLLHTALSETYCRLASAGLLPLRAIGVAAAEQTASALIDDLVASDQCPGTVSERRLAAWRLKQMARNLFVMEASAAGRLVLSETEVWVGGSRGVDVGGLKIRGRIDRVDTTQDGERLFVFDYKSGAIPAPSAIGTGAGLQLPLYLLALAAERPEADVIGGAYLSLTDKKRSGVVVAGAEEVLGSGTQGYRVLDEGGAGELFRATKEAALDAATGMRAGLIAPRADRECPSWCALGPACRARRGGYRP